ncbi:AaceriADL289Cp [[Ashbya] aceris (nom. inval.)]|nr:AaceriADL289Cp [[Ashbya] aceris (nom. inval.)]
MSGSRTSSQQILKEFASVVTEFQRSLIAGTGNQDPLQLVQEFRSIAGEAALVCAEEIEDEQDKTQFVNFELEAKLWYLVELLVSFRTSDAPMEDIELHDYNSNAVFKKAQLHEDPELYVVWLIIAWIQENLTVPPRPAELPTTKWSHTLLEGGLKSSDLDYPLREEGVKIHPKDGQDDHCFYKYMYELILAGKYEEARRECEYSDNLTLGMIMCGLEDYVDPRVDLELAADYEGHQGIKKRALWRRAVYALSRNPKLDRYEAAIYAFLSGTIPQDIDEQQLDWERMLLVYLNQIWSIKIENYLLEKERINKEELIEQMPSQPLSLSAVLNIVASKHADESEHPIRVLMGAVILNTISPAVKSFIDMLLDAVKGVDQENDLLSEPYILRILTHLVIFLDKACPGVIEEGDKSKLVTTYVSLLNLYEQYDLVPVYISCLNEQDIMEAYSFFLSTLAGDSSRERQLELCYFFQLPTANILKRTAQRIFNDTEPHYNPTDTITMNSDVTDIDLHLISAVDWLMKGRLHVDAVESIIALCRRFLANGKVNSLSTFFEQHNMDDLIKNYELDQLSAKEEYPEDRFVQEINQYTKLITGFKQYKDWEHACSTISSSKNVSALLQQFQAFANTLRGLVTEFLVDLTEHTDMPVEDRDMLYNIRSLYTPYLVIELHNCYTSAAEKLGVPSFLQEAVNLSTLVANESDKIYLLFQNSGKLKEYLHLVAKAVALIGH